MLFVDITSGCVGLTAWENGSLRYQHNVHIGTLRLLETFKQNQRDSLDFPQAMAEYIHAIMSPLWGAIKGIIRAVLFCPEEKPELLQV